MPYQDVEFTEDGCLTNDNVEQILENLNTFAECGDTVSEQFKCQQIAQQSAIASLGGAAACFTIQDGSNVSPADSAVEQKILFLDYFVEFNQGSNGSDVDPQLTTFSNTVRVFCDNQRVATIENSMNYLGIACFECSTSSTLVVCVFPEADNPTAPAIGIQGTAEVSICGSLVCTGTIARTGLESVFLPEYIPCGKYGRDFVHSALKNLRTLSESFSAFGQVPSCESLVFEDRDDHTLIFNSPTTFEYLIVGSVEVCVRRISNTNARLFVQPRSVCGDQGFSCNERRFVINASNNSDDFDDGDITCFRFPVVFCGECQPGDNLAVGFQQQIDCDGGGSATLTGGATIDSVRQEYCAFYFRRVQNELGANIPLGLPRCIPLEVYQDMSQSMKDINAACQSLRSVNATIREKPDNAPIITSSGDSTVIQEALPWPPLDDPTNTEPVPIKKWWLSLNVTACFRGQISNNNSQGGVITGTVVVQCGGQKINPTDINNTIPFEENFQSRPRCMQLEWQGCIECPIDEDISLLFIASENTDGFIVGNTFECDYKMICY